MVNSPTARVTRSFRHRDMGSIQAAESPSFSIGVGDSNNRRTTRRSRRNTSTTQATNSPSTNNRRSTRRAAQTARTIIAQELAPQRRSNRLAASKPDDNNNTSSSPVVRRNRNQPSRRIQASTNTTTSPTRRPRRILQTTAPRVQSPIDLCDSDSTVDAMDLKPAAKTELSSAIAGASSLAVKPPPLEDITCPICLDTPSSMTQVAKISGCDHRFCFDCIDKWADTENKW